MSINKVMFALILGMFVGIFLANYEYNNLLALLSVVGKIYLNLLKLIVVPIVFLAIIFGITQLQKPATSGTLLLKALCIYTITTAFAISMSLLIASNLPIAKPIDNISVELTIQEPGSLTDAIVQLFPKNLFKALVDGDIIPIIFLSFLFGFAISMLKADYKAHITKSVEILFHTVLKAMDLILLLTPIGVFSLVSVSFANGGFSLFYILGGYFFTVILVLILHFLFIYGYMVYYARGHNILWLISNFKEAMLFAFSTASSNASIPIVMQTAKEKLEIDPKVAAMVIPLGSTINMDATAIMQGVATCMIANMYGIELGLYEYLLVIATATLSSIGTAGIPSAGLVTLIMVLNSVGLPTEPVGMLLGIDRLLDMCRTMVNVTGDVCVAMVCDRKK